MKAPHAHRALDPITRKVLLIPASMYPLSPTITPVACTRLLQEPFALHVRITVSGNEFIYLYPSTCTDWRHHGGLRAYLQSIGFGRLSLKSIVAGYLLPCRCYRMLLSLLVRFHNGSCAYSDQPPIPLFNDP